MQIERLADVIEIMADSMAPRQRCWILGAARLVDLDETHPVTTDDIERLLAHARNLGFYPTGRAAYLPEAAVTTTTPEYEAVAAQIELGEPAYYQGMIGLGTCRDVALAESYRIEGPDADGVLLSDVEAAVADLLILAYGRSTLLDYRGRIDLMIALSARGLPTSPGLWHVDEESGRAVPTGRHVDDFAPVEYTASTTSTFEELFDVVRVANLDVTEQFGVQEPDLTPRPRDADVAAEIEARRAGLARHGITPMYERGPH